MTKLSSVVKQQDGTIANDQLSQYYTWLDAPLQQTTTDQQDIITSTL